MGNRCSPIFYLALTTVWLNGYAQQAEPANGSVLFAQNCASCHGADLRGGASAGSLIDGNWQFGSTRTHLIRNISDGISARGMPGFGQMLSEDQINQLVTFIQSKESEEAPPADAKPAPGELSTLDYAVTVEVFAEGLEIPWAMDFADPQTALITERPGQLRMVKEGRLVPEPVAGTPEVLHEGQGGLLDVSVDPDYAQNGWIYLGYSHALEDGNEKPVAMTRIVRGRIRDHRWVDQQVLFEAPHATYLPTRQHYGTRIVFDPDGYLYFSIGDRGRAEDAQDLSRPNGKIHRIQRDGSIPKDNPFLKTPGALPSIYSYGHRNPQGIAVHPETGEIWAIEHGPRGGDELNLVSKGRNYGWPTVSYGINYNGSVLTKDTSKAGLAQPILYWNPSIAVCGLNFYQGSLFDRWQNHLLVSALKFEEVQLLNLHEQRVLHSEVILKAAGRVRETRSGPDGAIYVVQNDPGRVLRLTPKSSKFWD